MSSFCSIPGRGIGKMNSFDKLPERAKNVRRCFKKSDKRETDKTDWFCFSRLGGMNKTDCWSKILGRGMGKTDRSCQSSGQKMSKTDCRNVTFECEKVENNRFCIVGGNGFKKTDCFHNSTYKSNLSSGKNE